ncbi:dimethylsulfone monooxygenase SfnG [Zavarzinia compransoris]|uniref:Dimethyl sulfone monooxygenase SfnG n=1 Tax=Zavarzinia compransoris TaxID=1264899 RepID=A0A317E8L1_9PROT|nr:dimethyl sulfone monooxygenase SfnG [Zavarzinia compransoris]PWR23219.1 dimethyl sulfone monooxygenase SfnG [Zavarzinia compransoris]TDP46221.1 FMNH2-dependent dimethyl sulfone monooxygenase [Zavarzinia compransoris]
MNAITPVAPTPEDAVKFAYWVPNVSGGLVVSKIPQRTEWNLDYNIKLARIAEEAGFDYALSQIRFIGSYGAEYQHESTTFSTALLAATKRLKVIAAILPGPWHPAVVAKLGASADQLFGGRWAVNVVSGWFKGEFTALGLPWLEHDERYRRSREFIQVLKGIWTEDNFTFKGDFYQTNDFNLRPRPLQAPHPEIFQGGNSRAAKENAGAVSDWYFANGNTPEGHKAQFDEVNAIAARNGRAGKVKFGVNAFIIARDTEREARAELQAIIDNADVEAVNAFGGAVKQAGQASPEGDGMWSKSTFNDLVQYNDGFKTNLIGTPEQIAERIYHLKTLGVNLVLGGFLHFQEEVAYFGEKVLPLVRELERAKPIQAAVA